MSNTSLYSDTIPRRKGGVELANSSTVLLQNLSLILQRRVWFRKSSVQGTLALPCVCDKYDYIKRFCDLRQKGFHEKIEDVIGRK
ncbi:hypothetical protein FOZ61_000403 [Perkinsus olseni]|uniref:Uncharacterized protein n=1 Tax=Perkinsus olseni TaxID=32597 RepID=A0A7J6KUV9_PEROL|nr:hypothetical protein FOZ61_000403 [Perkinsus olseni]